MAPLAVARVVEDEALVSRAAHGVEGAQERREVSDPANPQVPVLGE
jgi:hypothetical protein